MTGCLPLGMTNPPNKKIIRITNIPKVLATTIDFKTAPRNRNKPIAIWWVAKKAKSIRKNLQWATRWIIELWIQNLNAKVEVGTRMIRGSIPSCSRCKAHYIVREDDPYYGLHKRNRNFRDDVYQSKGPWRKEQEISLFVERRKHFNSKL